MSVPDFQTMMLPFLRFSEDSNEHSLKEAAMFLSKHFELSPDDLEELVPSGQQTRFNNRISWISTHLKKAGLIEHTKRGFYRISARGLDVLAQKPIRIDMKSLKQFPEYREFQYSKLENNTTSNKATLEAQDDPGTPEELLHNAYKTIRRSLAFEILETTKSCSPAFFERVVVDLLVTMGYGGTHEDAGAAIGKSGDGGIDGIIKEDRLGLDIIYLQAKRWEGNVSRPEIQKFAGALLGNQARKGVFITTSSFTKEARDYVKTIASTIILIDGDDLAELMIDYNVGVSAATAYEIKRIDSDYFIEE